MIRTRLAMALAAVTSALALTLTGCGGLPTSGPVNPGLPIDVVPSIPDFSVLPDRPQAGATPEQIVEGFIRAARGPADNWGTARLFLAPSIRESWKPDTVTVDRPERRVITVNGNTVQLGLDPVADVDVTGAYRISDGIPAPLSYELAKQGDGEWRIIKAPDGIVLDEDFFGDVFQPYALMYFDPTWSFLVPDVRWFPARAGVATRITQELIEGVPSPWLAGSVYSAVTEDIALALPSVSVTTARVAQIGLASTALDADPVTLSRLARQLAASLAGANVSGVNLLAGGVDTGAVPADVSSTAVDAFPLVRMQANFGFLSGDEITRIPGISDAVEQLAVTSVDVGRAQRTAALRLANGLVMRVDAGGARVEVDARSGLIDPAIDPSDDIWTVPLDNPGALTVTGADRVTRSIADAWPGATRITSLQVSRDGTRIAATLTIGGREWVEVAGIIRDGAGLPIALGEPLPVARLNGPGIDVAWLDDQTLGVVLAGSDAVTVLEQTVGGVGDFHTGPEGATASIASGGTAAPLRLLTVEGDLVVRRGATWRLVATGVAVLGTQQAAH